MKKRVYTAYRLSQIVCAEKFCSVVTDLLEGRMNYKRINGDIINFKLGTLIKGARYGTEAQTN